MAYLYKKQNQRVKIHSSSFYIEEELLEKLSKLAKYQHISRSVLIELILSLSFKSFFDERIFYEEFQKCKNKIKKKVFASQNGSKKPKQNKQRTSYA